MRAAEYGIPIFRLASSGISQYADGAGHVVATAPCPGDGAMLAGTVGLANAGRLPLDRWLGPFAAGVTGAGKRHHVQAAAFSGGRGNLPDIGIFEKFKVAL